MSEPIRRFRSFDVKARAEGEANTGKISFVASTDDACDWGGWREVLKHDKAGVDVSACRALLINHDPNQIAGPLRSITFKDGICEMDAEVLESARLQSGLSVRDAIECGALRGISIGYTYARADAEYDEDARTITVNKWRLLEASVTPIPADTGASIRSFPTEFKKEPVMADPILPDAAALAANSEATRAATIKEAREVGEQAKSLGLDGIAYVGMTREAAKDKMLADLVAKRGTTDPEQPVVPAVTRVDGLDKARDAITGALAHGAQFRGGQFQAIQDNNPLRGRGIQDMIRFYAGAAGERTQNWSRQDLAWYALGKPQMISGDRAANVTSGMFSDFVMLNAMKKIVGAGFEMGSSSARYRDIVSANTAPDFKTFYIGGLGMGNLVKTAENTAFPELDKAEASYNSRAKMWGGTMSLSLEALTNDDTGEFLRHLRMAGAIADKTIDRRVFQKLLMGTSSAEGTSTWTSNTTSGGSLVYTTADLAAAARGRLGLVRAALGNKLGLDGNPLGTMPRFLVVPLTREIEALGITGGAGPLLNANGPSNLPSIQVVATPWLEASALTGASATSYYLLGDPNEVTGLVLTKVAGFENIQVIPYDAGAVAAMNWKMFLPFEADLFSDAYTPANSTTSITVVPAAQQGTT